MKKLFSTLIVALFAVGFIAAPVYAMDQADDTRIVRADETVDDDYFAAADEVIIEGTVTGDAYIAASKVVISGNVAGDVIAIGETIEITGTVGHDVRAAGNSISFVDANVGDGISIAGNTLSVDRGSSIGGGALFAGANVTISGSVARGITGGGADVRLDGTVGKSVKISADQFTLAEQAIIEGDLSYDASDDAVLAGIVRGETTVSDNDLDVNVDASGFLKSLAVGYSVWAFVSALIVAGVLSLIGKRMFGRVHGVFEDGRGKVVLYGLLALFVTLPLAVLVMVTVVGIPLALVVIGLWMIALYMAKFFFAQAIGSHLLARFSPDRKNSVFLAMVLGLILYYVLRMIPFIGFFVRLIATVVGLGIMLALAFDRGDVSGDTLKTGKKKPTVRKARAKKQIA